MLLAAGFAAPAPIEIPFAERVQRAQQLRADGLSWAEIGELLGVGADTARRYVNAHSCECGEPILARDARLCRRCSSRHRTRWGRVFTEAEIIAAIRRWAKLEGRAPAIVDWRPADHGGHPRWERDCPRFPPRSHVTRRFGSWNAALQAAGFDRPRPPAWSDQEILARLRAWAGERGFAPSSVEWDGSPDRDVVSRRFGGWNAALRQAGLEPRFVRRRWTDEDILDGLRRWEADHGRPPRSMDRVGFGGEYPSPALVVTRFGSWRQALIAAGLEPGNPPRGDQGGDHRRSSVLPRQPRAIANHQRLARRATVPGKRDDHPPLRVMASGPRARRVAPTRPHAAWAERRRDTRGAARLPSGTGGAADNSGVERAASPAGLQADPRPVRIVDRSTRPCRNRPLIGEQPRRAASRERAVAEDLRCRCLAV